MGHRYINGVPVDPDQLLPAAFVEQDVNFFPHMTVAETLQFRVSLKLGSLVSASEKDAMVHNLMEQLGLTKSADTIVGNTKIRGLSGGERKRLSIAVEMISSPSLIFLDEPTSGLDSSAAASLVQKLRTLADDQGKTVVAVIHQRACVCVITQTNACMHACSQWIVFPIYIYLLTCPSRSNPSFCILV